MKRLLTLSLTLAACGPSQPREQPEAAVVESYPKAAPPEPEKFEPDDGLTLADRLEGTIDVEEIMKLGVDTERAKKELHDLHRVVVFTTCLGEQLNEAADGAIVESHIRRGSKEARACAGRIKQMTAEEISASATKAVEDSERAQ